MPGEFTGKVVVITGGSRGIGRGIAIAFAREGAQTVLAATTQKNLEATANAIGKTGAPMPAIVAGHLGSLQACQAVHGLVKDKFGRCDVLVNCAGATKAGSFVDQPDDDWTDGFATKFFGAVRLSRLFWPMLKQAQGHVVNIAGGAGRTPDSTFLIGGSVNAAMLNFTKGLSQLGKKDGVNVNAILPGMTETDRVVDLIQQRAKATGASIDDARKSMLEKSGTRRIGTPEDVAELAVFLCSPRASHIQGTNIAVDGGATAGLY
jgi:NAD(P)-dependent dehydrogenase (short-subunit alcohol dehydrogenase family)